MSPVTVALRFAAIALLFAVSETEGAALALAVAAALAVGLLIVARSVRALLRPSRRIDPPPMPRNVRELFRPLGPFERQPGVFPTTTRRVAVAELLGGLFVIAFAIYVAAGGQFTS